MVLDFCLAFLNFPPFFLELYMFLVFFQCLHVPSIKWRIPPLKTATRTWTRHQTTGRWLGSIVKVFQPRLVAGTEPLRFSSCHHLSCSNCWRRVIFFQFSPVLSCWVFWGTTIGVSRVRRSSPSLNSWNILKAFEVECPLSPFWSVKRHQKATMDIQRPQSRKAASSRTWPALLRSFKFKVIEAFGWFWLTFMKLGSRRGFKPWVLDAFLGRRETCGISWSHLQCLLGSGINARMAGMLPVWRRTVKVEELST